MSNPGNESQTPRLVALPDAEDSTSPAGITPPVRGEHDEGVPRRIFLLTLVFLALAVLAAGVQSWRASGLQGDVDRLQGEVSALSGNLAVAEQRLLDFEAEREQIRSSVARLRQDLLALEALVASDPLPDDLIEPTP